MGKVAKLFEQIVPEHYELSLDLDIEKMRIRGLETITFVLKAPSRKLTFHGVNLDVKLAELEKGARATVETDSDEQTVTMVFEKDVPAGAQKLRLSFEGKINDSLHGAYKSNYQHDGEEKSLIVTQFEAVHAREAFICIDEPAAKAVFELSLTVPDTLTALSNTIAVSEALAGPGLKKVKFGPTPKMSTYLAAWVVGELEHVEGQTPEGVAVRCYATPGQTGQLSFALDVAVKSLSFYNDYFGTPYPLPNLDMVAIPDFASGAMENWGLVTYRETALMLDPAQTSLMNKQRVAEVVAHELAHQWFGNLVTMAWWDDLWLNEGFATWVASLAMDKLFPEWNVWTAFVEEEYDAALGMNSLASAPALQVDIEDPRELDSVFDPAVVYAKGASVIRMLDAYLGRETFQKGLQIYLKRHSFANSVTHDLWKALGEASGKPVDEVMSDWTARPGYPLLSYEEGEVRQRRFYASPREAEKAKGGEVWPVPFAALLAGGETTEEVLVTKAATPLPVDVVGADWFKPNPGQTAFYRSLYTTGMVDALAGPLHDKTLAPTDRFGVVSDVVATTEAGLTDATVMLKLVEALREESDYVVWGAVSGGLGAIGSIVEDEPLRDRLDGFGRWLVQPNVARLGWTPKEGESSFETLMRPLVLSQAVRFDDEAVTREARRRFDKYLEGGGIDPDLRPAILFSAARHGDAGDFDALIERYRAEKIPQVKISLLGTLARFRKPALIDRFLEFALTEDVRPQDVYIVLAWGFRNREGRDQVWQWVKDNWDLWIERYGGGGHMLERFPLYAASGYATHKMAGEIQEFFDSHPHPATKRPTVQAVEGLELRADWYDRDKTKLEAFLATWSTGTVKT